MKLCHVIVKWQKFQIDISQNQSVPLNIQENSFIVNLADHILDPIDKVLHKFEVHPSILALFSNVTHEELLKERNSLNPKKSNTSNSIPVKSLKENADIVGNILYEIINSDICNSYFPEKLKLAEISPLQKDNDVMNKTKYRPVSILPSIF